MLEKLGERERVTVNEKRMPGSVTRIRREKWKTDGKKKCMGSMSGT